MTGTSDEEYDGDKNPDLYPLPNTDFEIIYDPATETLTYRFRSNGQGVDGSHDNNVDQRFISRLVQNRTFTYEVDMSRYGTSPVSTRSLKFPYSIMQAFTERKISLALTADNMTFTLPPGSVETTEVRALGDYGQGSVIEITVSTNATGTPQLAPEENYASTPQKLGVKVVSPSKTVTLTNLAQPQQVAMKLDSRAATQDKNVGAYFSDENEVGWQRVGAGYNNVPGAITLTTPKVANFAAVERSPLVTVSDPDSLDAYLSVNAKLDLRDMGAFDSRLDVTANQFNNIVAAVANNRPLAALDGMLSEAEFTSLGKAKVLVSGANVSREAGVGALVRLYELKTKRAVKNYPTLRESTLPGIAAAAQQYQVPLLKADALGFFDGESTLNPQGNLSMGELMRMVNIIMDDAGL
jgi:hypothetical protein